MFNLGEEVKIDLHDKTIHLVGVIIEMQTDVKYRKGEIIYKVLFKSGNIGRFYRSELIKL